MWKPMISFQKAIGGKIMNPSKECFLMRKSSFMKMVISFRDL